jgi:twitching motility protein PilI
MAKRVSLREFQQGLVERLTSARRGEAARALLGVQAANDYWLLDLPDVGEILPLTALTAVPLTRPWFRGLANIRGTLYAVVDFASFQGAEPVALLPEARLLFANSRFGFQSALLVNRALGLRNPEQLDPRPDLVDPRPWVGEHYADTQGHVWKTLLIRELFGDPAFLDVAV